MNLTTANLQAIEKIYNVVTEPKQWPTVLDSLDEQVGSIGCNVFVMDHTLDELTSAYISTRLLPTLNDYLSSGMDRIEAPASCALREIIPGRKLTRVSDAYLTYMRLIDASFDGKPIANLLEKSAGIVERYTTPLSYQPKYIDLVTFSFDTKHQDDNKIEFGNILLPHLAKVIELSRPFALLQTRFSAVLDVLNRFHLGVFILSTSGSVITDNSAAMRIVDLNDGLRLKSGGRLRAICSSDDAQLQSLIDSVATQIGNPNKDASRQMIISRNSKSTPYIVEVSPLQNSNLDPGNQFRAVLVTVIDPDYHTIVDTSGLTLLFGLTSAEQQVCKLLVGGQSTSDMADARNTSPETIRNQVKSLLNKTGSAHRAELVRLALSINLPVDSIDQAHKGNDPDS
jgi:DNA-binding CsgD family transcriptional regulator